MPKIPQYNLKDTLDRDDIVLIDNGQNQTKGVLGSVFLDLASGGGSTDTTVDNAAPYNEELEGGYRQQEVVSYINVDAVDELFHDIALYIAVIPVPEGISPEESLYDPDTNPTGHWKYSGEKVEQSDNSTNIGVVSTINDLQNISNIRNGSTCSVIYSGYTFKFSSTSNYGIRPLSGEDGSWSQFAKYSHTNNVSKVLTKEDNFDTFFMPAGNVVIVYEVDPVSNSLSFSVEDETATEMLTITVTEPSVITKTGTGYTLADFAIKPIGGSTTIITPDDKDPFDPLHPEIEGLPGFAYLAGEIVSYQNVLSADPQFQVKALYIADENIPIVDGLALSPEETALWIWQGTEIDVPSNSGATVFVPSITALRQITGYKIGDTVSVVQGFTYKYMNVGTFQNGVDQYPFDQLVQDGNCWTYRWSSTELSMIPKISYSNLKYIIDGDDYDGASVTLDYQEGLILLNASIEVTINGQNFTNQPNCIIYRNSQGVLVQETLGGGGLTPVIHVDTVEYDLTPTAIPTTTGSQYWDVDEQTISLILADGGSYQFGKELFDHYHVLQAGGIVNGDIVSVVGASGNRSAVSLTDVTNDTLVHSTIGMCTVPSVANNNVGRITKQGKVHELNTLGLTEGLPVYVHPTQPGKWTQTKPSAPIRSIYIGVVVVSHSTQGVIDLDIKVLPKLSELTDVTTASKTTPVDADNLLIQDSADQSIWKRISLSILKNFFTKEENIFFDDTATSAKITRPYNFKVTSKTESGGTGTITTSADAAYTLGATITANDYVKVTASAVNTRVFLTIEKVI